MSVWIYKKIMYYTDILQNHELITQYIFDELDDNVDDAIDIIAEECRFFAIFLNSTIHQYFYGTIDRNQVIKRCKRFSSLF